MGLKEQENREILITRYITGETSSDENVELKKLLDASKDNLLYLQQVKNIWDNSEHISNEKMIDAEKSFIF